MEFTKCLPFEVLEEIFSYLSDTDLVTCSQVSVEWREAANSDKLWRRICKKLPWNDPSGLCDVKSNFSSQEDQFFLPQLSDRLTQISDWKLSYCQQKYISHNWRRGHCATHSVGRKIVGPRLLSFVSTGPAVPRISFLPMLERLGDHYEFSIMRIDGEPTKVCCLERYTTDVVSVICVAGHTIAYVMHNILKVATFVDGKFSVIREHKLHPPMDEVSTSTRTIGELESETSEHNCYIYMNSDYLIAGHESFYIHIWDRKTGDKLGRVEAPVPKGLFPVMTAICLHGDRLYFGVKKRREAFEYNIVDKSINSISAVRYPIKEIFSNGLYLILVSVTIGNMVKVLVYDVIKRAREMSFTLYRCDWRRPEPIALFENNLLFCYEPWWIKVLAVPSCETVIQFSLYNIDVLSLHPIRQNLLCLRTNTRVEVWDLKKEIKLFIMSSVDYMTSYLYYDMIRLIVMPKYKGKAKVIGFW